MADPYAESVRFDGMMGNIAGALQDLMMLAQDVAIRSQIYHALQRKESQIRSLMPARPGPMIGARRPAGPTIGPLTSEGVLVVVWIDRSEYPDPNGGFVKFFKRVDVVGAFHSREMGIDTFNRTPRIDSVEKNYVSEPSFLFLTP